MKRLLVFVLGLSGALVAGAVLAQAWPSKPVKLIVTYPPGGSSDLLARVFGAKLSEVWGHPVVVESKPGAAGSIASSMLRNIAVFSATLSTTPSPCLARPV